VYGKLVEGQMPGLPDEQKARSPFKAIAQWYRRWAQRSSASEFKCLGDDMVERMAQDVGMSSEELRRLARLGPGAADLLPQRMAALDLDQKEVAREEPQTLHDLQRVCAMCEYHRRCARDLGHDPDNPEWKHYCPNATTLEALNAQPWTWRGEW
jgi:DNA-binding transcriptional LysR family regulator